MTPHNLHHQTHKPNAVLYNHDPVLLSRPVTMDSKLSFSREKLYIVRGGRRCLIDQSSKPALTRQMTGNLLSSSKNVVYIFNR